MADKTNQTIEDRVAASAKQYKVDYEAVPLSKPFDIAGLEVEALYIREPVACDFDHLEVEEGESSMKGVRQLVCALCGVAGNALDSLPMSDYGKLMAKVKPFLEFAQ